MVTNGGVLKSAVLGPAYQAWDMVSLQTEASPLHPFRLRIAVHGPPSCSTMGMWADLCGGVQASTQPNLERFSGH